MELKPNPYAKVWYAGTHPACFEGAQEYQDWRKAAYVSHSASNPLLACMDCTPAFQSRMKACGRCENPHVSFRNGEGFVYPTDLQRAKEERA